MSGKRGSLLSISLWAAIATGVAAPDSPPGLSIALVTHSVAKLSWKAPQNEGPLAYFVYRDGKEIGMTDQTAYIDDRLQRNERHVYHVTSFNLEGRESPPSGSVVLKTTVSPGSVENLLENGGFEQGRSSWMHRGGYFSIIEPAFSGGLSARFDPSSDDIRKILGLRDIELEPDTEYYLSFAAKARHGGEIHVGLADKLAPGSLYGVEPVGFEVSSAWRTFVMEFRTSGLEEASGSGNLLFWNRQSRETNSKVFYLDEVFLRKK